MVLTIIIFFIAIIGAFGMLTFRAWEIKTSRVERTPTTQKIIPEMHFRHVEKIVLHLIKHGVQWVVLIIAKHWFITYTKTKKWVLKKLPKVHEFFKKKSKDINQQKNSFFHKAILESKAKIRHVREKVRREHEE